MGYHRINIFTVIVGLILIFIALNILGLAARRMFGGSCMTGCCLWEMGEGLMDLGCGLIGCGGTLAVLALPLFAWLGWLHH